VILTLFFETADHFKEVINRPCKLPSLRDITIANIFLKIVPEQNSPLNSTKGYLLMLLVFSSSIFCEGETLIDTVNNILSMKVDMVVMRHANPGAAHFYQKM
jgi:aspartate carbamoyltransferase catalytic subunit